jgi:cellulose biosynthesis protein BcsQ
MSESMFVLAFISQKGVPCKTTLAVNLAVAAAEQGLAAVIIDLDPRRMRPTGRTGARPKILPSSLPLRAGCDRP